MRFISCTAAQPITLEAYPVTVLHISPDSHASRRHQEQHRSGVPQCQPNRSLRKSDARSSPKGDAKGKIVALRVSAAAKAKSLSVSEWICSTLNAALEA